MAGTADTGGVKPLRFLILDAGMGAGHAAVADELRLRLERHGHEITTIDVLDLLPADLGAGLRTGYRLMVSRAPWLYDAVYAAFFRTGRGPRPSSTPLANLAGARLSSRVPAVQPHVIVPVFHLAAQITGGLRAGGKLDVPVAVFLTDFAVHRQWLHPGNDIYLCVSDQAADVVRATGRRANVTGPVVPRRFFEAADGSAWAHRFARFAASRVPVLIATGSWGVGGGLDATTGILTDAGFLPVVLCGRNAALRSRLARRRGVLALGWIDDLPAIMAASAAMVDNAAGQTAVQALAAGLPVIGYRPIAGHGTEGVEAMAALGVTARAHHPDDLVQLLNDAAANSAGTSARRTAGRELFRADAAAAIEELATERSERIGGRL